MATYVAIYLRIMPKQVQTLIMPVIDRLIEHLKAQLNTSREGENGTSIHIGAITKENST
jgi:hypothetical protein